VLEAEAQDSAPAFGELPFSGGQNRAALLVHANLLLFSALPSTI
jgi:hypothetical protein